MTWTRPGRRALIAVATVVAALLPVSLIAAVSALGDGPARPGGNSGGGPAIVSFAPNEGPITGGTGVHISGGGFVDVTGVFFGTRPARSFEVKSDNFVDAIAPKVPRGGEVRITVHAAGGSATSNASYEFRGCHVPALREDRIPAARRELHAAGCRTGGIRRAPDARQPLRVVAVHPRPGTWMQPGARVRLRVR
ncbi:MAG TPA: IPT/TIG domain-containing protein [Solirubrobacterales bacterium]|nr:IPT/TIG domain-containing protein [Solirubrobacterales bacterium]